MSEAAGWDKIMISSCKANAEYVGRSLLEIAELKKLEPANALFELLIESEAEVLMVVFMMCEEDVSYIIRHPAVMAASDSLQAHPRYYGTFPRVFRQVCKAR